MMYISVPEKTRIKNKCDLHSFHNIIALFAKHEFGIAEYSNNGARVYRKPKIGFKADAVPITSVFNLSKKDFLLMIELIRRLDDATNKRDKYLKIISNS